MREKLKGKQLVSQQEESKVKKKDDTKASAEKLMLQILAHLTLLLYEKLVLILFLLFTDS